MKTKLIFSNTLYKSVFCLTLFMSVLMVGFASCSDDEDDNTNKGIGIVGTWQSTHAEIWNKINGVLDDEGYDGPYTLITLVFDKNGNFKIQSEESDEDLELGFNVHGTYSLSGNSLKLKVEGVTEEMKVLQLTDSKLEIEYYFDDGVVDDEHLTGYMRLECKRVK
ncbi:lipocalin family protein [Bacteroides sp.]|uniref:lipocalin family protein n=1 Tax=Bacteroides sp. TaxID=29523 RepID=UPI00257A586A|nr:lipocalin family protein [Bacteroides sp.]